MGCTVGDFEHAHCPEPYITRAETASLLVQAFGPEAAGPAGFEDVANVPFVPDIDALFGGITVGCSAEPLLYCPKRLTTRGQMAAFLNRARNN